MPAFRGKSLAGRAANSANSLFSEILRNSTFVFSGIEKMIELYPTQNSLFKPKTPWGGYPWAGQARTGDMADILNRILPMTIDH